MNFEKYLVLPVIIYVLQRENLVSLSPFAISIYPFIIVTWQAFNNYIQLSQDYQDSISFLNTKINNY